MFTSRSARCVMHPRSDPPRSAAVRAGDHRRRDFAFPELHRRTIDTSPTLDSMTAHSTLRFDGARPAGSGLLAAGWSAPAGARGESVCPVAIRIIGDERDSRMTRGQSGRKLAAGYRQPRAARNGAGTAWGVRTP